MKSPSTGIERLKKSQSDLAPHYLIFILDKEVISIK
jgi:hypothetical protein